MRPPSRPRPIRVGLVAAVLIGVAAPPVAQADPLRSWSASPQRFFQETDYASETTVAQGRVWQVSFDRQTKPVLRSRRLTDGREASVPVRIPRPRGATLLSETSGSLDTQLVIAGTRGFVSGDWCVSPDSDVDECERSRGFSVQFDIRTGRVFRSSQPRESPLLIPGDRVSYLARPESGPMVVRDALTRRRVFTLPRDAREVQGAGPYVAWKDPDAYERESGEPGAGDVGPNWSAIHVRERASGRVVYDLRERRLGEQIQRGGVAVQDADLQADGSLTLGVDLDAERSFRPVVVDGTGRVHRVSERPMRKPNQFWSGVSGARVLLSVSTNGGGTCGPETGWLTAPGGHVGNTLSRLPHGRGYAIAFGPAFLTPSTMSWVEEPTDPESRPTGRYRVRVGHDLRTLPLTRGERPRC